LAAAVARAVRPIDPSQPRRLAIRAIVTKQRPRRPGWRATHQACAWNAQNLMAGGFGQRGSIGNEGRPLSEIGNAARLLGV